MILEVHVRDSKIPEGYRNWSVKEFEVDEDSPVEWLWRANIEERRRWMKRITEKVENFIGPEYYDVMVMKVDGQSTAYRPFTENWDWSDYMTDECINSLPMRMW